jgi:hypothetical protein
MGFEEKNELLLILLYPLNTQLIWISDGAFRTFVLFVLVEPNAGVIGQQWKYASMTKSPAS